MWKLIRRVAATLLIISSLLITAIVGAAVQMFDGQGKYIMSDFENHDIAKQRAIQRAEKDAQKKAGVYLTQFSKSVNSELTTDEISAVTNNIIKVSDVNVKPVPFEANGEAGLMYEVTLKATIDTDGIYDFINSKTEEKITLVQRNTRLQNAIQTNDAQIELLKEKYRKAKTPTEKAALVEESKQVDREFLAIQKVEEAKYLSLDTQGKQIELCNEAIELDPNYAEAYRFRGLAYSRLQNYEAAFKDLSKAIELAPDDVLTYKARVFICRVHLDKFDLAIQDLTKMIELVPNEAEFYFERAEINTFLKNYAAALPDYTKYIQLKPNEALGYGRRSMVYMALGDRAKAQADAAKFKEIYANRGY